MSGLEKIIGQIDAQAKADAAELLRDARADAEELRNQAQAGCRAELAQIQERSTRDIAACRARAASALEQQRRMALLQTKQEIIGQMLQSALHTLQAEPADAYFAAVEKLVERFARPGVRGPGQAGAAERHRPGEGRHADPSPGGAGRWRRLYPRLRRHSRKLHVPGAV